MLRAGSKRKGAKVVVADSEDEVDEVLEDVLGKKGAAKPKPPPNPAKGALPSKAEEVEKGEKVEAVKEEEVEEGKKEEKPVGLPAEKSAAEKLVNVGEFILLRFSSLSSCSSPFS